MKHIEFEKLVEEFEERSSLDNAAEVNAHLANCRACSEKAAALGEFFAYARSIDKVESVPQAVTARILNTYDRRPIPAEHTVEPERAGFLIFDDWTMALAERHFGLDSRQLLYRIDGLDIDLRLEFSDAACTLVGQVLPDAAGALIEIRSADFSAEVRANDFSEFEFENIPFGVYEIVISEPEKTVRLENVPLKR